MWILIERLKRFQWLVVILAAIAFWIFVYRKLPYSAPLAWGDFPLYPIQGAVALAKRVIFAWQPVGLGFSEYTFPGRLAISLLVALLGNDSLLAHNVYYLALLPIASLAFYLCTARAIKSGMARAIAALLYVMNPAVIGQFAGGSPELLFSYALIPVAALCFEKLGGDRVKNLAIWVLASGVVIAAGFSFYLSFMLVSIPLLMLPLIVSVNDGIKALIRLPVLIFLSYALALLLTITLSFPLIQSALGSTTDTLTALRPGNTIGSFLANIRYTYGLAKPISTLRLAGDSAAADFWLGYQTPGELFNLAGFVIPLVAFASLLRKKSASPYTVAFGALALLVISYMFLLQNWGPPKWLFEHVTVLVGARNPVPVMLVLSFAMSILFGLSLDGWLGRDVLLRQPPGGQSGAMFLSRVFPVALVVGGLLVYGWPFMTGDLGIRQLFAEPISVPSVYREIGDWLHAHRADEFERVLLLPFDNGSRVAMGMLPSRVVEDQLSRSQNRYADFVLDTLVKGQVDNLGMLLAPLNVRYVVINLDSSQEGTPNVYVPYGPYLYGSAQEYQKILDRQSDLRRVFISPDFVVYESAERAGEVAFFAHTNVFAVDQTIEPVVQANAVSPTEYRADVPSQATAVLLNESFDPGWVASRDGCQLARLENAYSMNAFDIQSCPNARGELIIEYAPQRIRFVLLAILAAAWGVVLVVLLFKPARVLFQRISSVMAR